MRTYRGKDGLDLSNADGLDESVSNMVSAKDISSFVERGQNDRQYDFTNESLLDGLTTDSSLLNADGYSNGDGGSKVSPEMVQAGVSATTAVVAGIQANRNSPAGQGKRELKNACGRKPWFRKKKAKWQECVNSYMKSKESASTSTTPPPVDSSQRTMNPSGDDSSGKILGMSKGLAIGLGIAVLAVGVFVTIKVIRARAVKVK